MKAEISKFGSLTLIAETDEESLLIITNQFKRKFGEGPEFSTKITKTFADKQRKDGYYWVKYSHEWVISKYSHFTWDVKPIDGMIVMDSDIEEIDEREVTRGI